MRKPTYLSHSSLSLWTKDREEFYISHLAATRAPRLPQERPMSIGSAFDAYVKAALHEALFGKGADPKYEFDAIFPEQVEEHNRDWARPEGQYVFDCYKATGSYDDLLKLLEASMEPPRFEFKVDGVIGGVPLLGKPDCRFVLDLGEGPVHVILDWKVKGFCSKYTTSPSKGYMLCRDATGWLKPSRNHGKEHTNFLAMKHRGFTINSGYMEGCNPEYADQLSLYGWLLGEQVGDESVVLCIEEIVSKPMGEGKRPLLRVANHRGRVSAAYQQQLLGRAQECWNAIQTDWIFPEMTREENDSRCEILEDQSVGLQSGGSEEDAWFNAVTRPPIPPLRRTPCNTSFVLQASTI